MADIGIKFFDNTVKSIGKTSSELLEVVVTTIVDNQELVEIELYYIESIKTGIKSKIGTITVRDLPPCKAGEPKIHLKIKCSQTLDLDLKILVDDKPEISLGIPRDKWHHKETEQIITGSPEDNKEAVNIPVVLFSRKKDEPVSENIRQYAPGQLTQAMTKEKSVQTEKIEKIEKTEEEIEKEKKRAKKIAAAILIPAAAVAAIILIIWFAVPYIQENMIAGNSPVPVITKSHVSTGTRTAQATEMMAAVVQPTATEEAPVKTMTVTEAQIEATVTIAVTVTASPVEENITLLADRLQEILPVYFYPESLELLPGSSAKIDQLAELLGEYRGKIFIDIIGHAAEYGTAEGQMTISLNRAKRIRDELVKRNAVTADMCRIEGKGTTEPVYTGDDSAQLYQNRRVEITVRNAE